MQGTSAPRGQGGTCAGSAGPQQRASSVRRRLQSQSRIHISNPVRCEPDEELQYAQTLLSPTSSAISMFAPSTVPTSRPPFRQNFMFDVPDASVPAVEMCCEMSEAGMSTSASETE